MRSLFFRMFPVLLAAGVVYGDVPIAARAAKYEWQVRKATQEELVLSRAEATVSFKADSRMMQAGKFLVWMNAGASRKKDVWFISEMDWNTVVEPVLAPDVVLKRAGMPADRWVLDPGHGGKENGALGKAGSVEKDLVLDIARRVRQQFKDRDVQVHLTRTGDQTLSLAARSKFAADHKAEALVSIHLNAAGNPDARGIETYVLSGEGYPSTSGNARDTGRVDAHRWGPVNMVLGMALHTAMLEKTGAPDRGIKRARFDLLRDASSPAVLLECGFLSNRDEETVLLTEAYRRLVAEGIADGILGYVQQVRASQRSSRNDGDAAAP